jgi:hypothetical protein
MVIVAATVVTTVNMNITIDIHVGVSIDVYVGVSIDIGSAINMRATIDIGIAVNMGATMDIPAAINVGTRPPPHCPGFCVPRKHPAGSDNKTHGDYQGDNPGK